MACVRDVMNPKVITVRSDADVSELARVLIEKKVTGVPVTDGRGHLVGVVSLFDLASMHLPGQRPLGTPETTYWDGGLERMPAGFALENLEPEGEGIAVERIMTPAIHSIAPEASLSELCDYFLKGQIHRVLVCEGERLLGIVTSTDLVRHLQRLLDGKVALAHS